MTTTPLLKKLRIQPGHRMKIMNAPEGYLHELGDLPEGIELVKEPTVRCDFVHLFARTSDELNHFVPIAIGGLKPDGLFWISYPKRSSKIKTDLTRDEGWEVVSKAGLRPVTQVSINETWSAVRFRPSIPEKDLLTAQFSGVKADLRPIYDRLVQITQKLGTDVQVSPRKTYVALSRKKQFAVIRASTRTRLDLGLKLKGKSTTKRLIDAGNFGSGSITHKVSITSISEIDDELEAWMREAYEGVA